MIGCRELLERFAELVPGKEGVADELRHHLEDCAACRAYVEECRLAEHLGGLPLPPAPAHVKSALAGGRAAERPE